MVVFDVDAEVVVERGEDFAEGDGAVDGVFAQAVRRADHLAGPHAAAGQQGAADLRPVVAAGVFVDLRRAAEFAPDDDRHVAIQPALVQVFDQGADALIE